MSVELLFIIAFLLLVAEAFNPTKGILAIVGFIAYVYGVWILINSGVDSFYGVSVINVVILGGVFAAALIIFVIYLQKALKKAPETGTEFLTGKDAKVTNWDDGEGSVFVDGEDWRAVGPKDLKAGDHVKIVGYDKLTLTVENK